MFTTRFSTNSLVLCLLLSCSACRQAAQSPSQQDLDTVTTDKSDTIEHAVLDQLESSKADSVTEPPIHIETPEEKKERLYFARSGKNPLDFKHGAIRFYTDSTGRKWMDVPGDTVDIEVKE